MRDFFLEFSIRKKSMKTLFLQKKFSRVIGTERVVSDVVDQRVFFVVVVGIENDSLDMLNLLDHRGLFLRFVGSVGRL